VHTDPLNSRRRPAFVAAVSAVSAGLSTLFFSAGVRGLWYDSYHYFALSQIVSSEGLWNLQSRVRTYGYPLFVSLCTGFAAVDADTARALVFAAQLLLYLAASLYAARVAERVFGSARFFYGTYLVLALNPIVLIRSTELLSDTLSATLIFLAVLVSIERPHPARRVFLAFLCAGLAAAVRPAALVVLPALAVAWIVRARLYREPFLRRALPAAAAVALALLPQVILNGRAYGHWSPLPVERLYGEQAGWGMSILKYATVVRPGVDPRIIYGNPLAPKGVARPGEFFESRPAGYLKTLAMHGFALFDQDLPFTYVTNTRPWYRWPLSLANYAFLYLAALGLAVGLGRRHCPEEERVYFSAALLSSAALVAIYLPVAVESRFSLPVYMVLSPAVVFSTTWLAARRSGTALVLVIAGGGFIAICVQLSRWLSAQAPALASLAGS
jgi:hypothetical protein